MILLNNYKTLILSNPKIFFFLIKAWLSFPDLREFWYRTTCSIFCYRVGVQIFSQHGSICLPKYCNLFLERKMNRTTRSLFCALYAALYCTPSSYRVRTHRRKICDSSRCRRVVPLPTRCKITITIVTTNAIFSFLLKVWDPSSVSKIRSNVLFFLIYLQWRGSPLAMNKYVLLCRFWSTLTKTLLKSCASAKK